MRVRVGEVSTGNPRRLPRHLGSHISPCRYLTPDPADSRRLCTILLQERVTTRDGQVHDIRNGEKNEKVHKRSAVTSAVT